MNVNTYILFACATVHMFSAHGGRVVNVSTGRNCDNMTGYIYAFEQAHRHTDAIYIYAVFIICIALNKSKSVICTDQQQKKKNK